MRTLGNFFKRLLCWLLVLLLAALVLQLKEEGEPA